MKDAYLEVEKHATQTKDKVQKIVAALYLLTDHIDTENPVRIEIRTNAILLLKSVILGLKIENLKATISALLSVSVLTKDISYENMMIIERELDALKSSHSLSTEPILSHVFLEEKDKAFVERKEISDFQKDNILSQEQMKPMPFIKDSKPANYERDTNGTSKNKELLVLRTENSQAKKEEKKARRARVLEHLSKTEVRTIKDIAKFFTDCSEKTIQRELNDLVEEKIILRVGDRRWSTYKLV